jgi:hypothetical protein
MSMAHGAGLLSGPCFPLAPPTVKWYSIDDDNSGEARHDSDWPTNGELLGQRVRRVHIGLLETANSTKGSSDGTVVALLLSLARLFWCTTPFSRWLPGGHGYKGQWLSRG